MQQSTPVQGEFTQEESMEKFDTWVKLSRYLSDEFVQQRNIDTDLRNHLRKNGFPTPAPIQKMVLPYLLREQTEERFFYVKAPTGTGKTLSFIMPMLVFFDEFYLKNHFIQDEEGNRVYLPYALIMVNQHPLLRQIQEDFAAAAPPKLTQKGFCVQHFDKGNTFEEVKGHVLCAVPEKIRQLTQKGQVNLKNIRYIVVDEADYTIINDNNNTVLTIIKTLIKTGNLNWKMIVCGATIEHSDLRKCFERGLGELAEVKNVPKFFQFKYFEYKILLDNIIHFYYEPKTKQEMDEKLKQVITNMFLNFDGAQIMVFFNQKVECQNLYTLLKNDPDLKFLVENDQICEVRAAVKGEYITRDEQQKIVEQFRSEKKILMLCSDLMGRGMNFRKVRLVVNYGTPRMVEKGPIDMKRYDQRVGRTGRMEDLGVALTLFNPDNAQVEPAETELLKIAPKLNIQIDKYEEATFKEKFIEMMAKMKNVKENN